MQGGVNVPQRQVHLNFDAYLVKRGHLPVRSASLSSRGGGLPETLGDEKHE